MAKLKDFKLICLRKKIDKVDKKILRLIEKRFYLVSKVADRKKQKGFPVRDREREKEVIESKKQMTKLPSAFVGKLYRMLIEQAAKLENNKLR